MPETRKPLPSLVAEPTGTSKSTSNKGKAPTGSGTGLESTTLVKVGIAVVVLLVSVIAIYLQVRPEAPPPPAPPPPSVGFDRPAREALGTDPKWEQVRWQVDADESGISSILVIGDVRSRADLQELERLLRGVADTLTPKPTIRFMVGFDWIDPNTGRRVNE
jgi:hypothetical protein